MFVAGEGDSCNGLIALFFVVQCMFLWKRKLHRDLDQGSTSFLCKYIWSRSPISSQYVQLWFLQPFVKSLVLIEILMTKSLCIQMVLLVFSSVFLWWSFLCYKWEFFVLSMTQHWPHDPNDITNKDHRNWSYPSFFYHTHMCNIQKKNAISGIIDPLYLFITSQEFIANHHSNVMQGQHSGSVEVLNGCDSIEDWSIKE